MIFKRKIREYLKHHKYTFLLIFLSIGCGAIAGAFGASRTGMGEILPVSGLGYRSIIMSSFSENLKYLVWLAVWGMNGAGFLVILYLLYSKGATISAAIYALMANGTTNVVATALCVLPYVACTVASVIVLAGGSLECSWEVTKFVFSGRNTRGGSKKIYVVVIEFVLAALLSLLGGVCEAAFKVNIT